MRPLDKAALRMVLGNDTRPRSYNETAGLVRAAHAFLQRHEIRRGDRRWRRLVGVLAASDTAGVWSPGYDSIIVQEPTLAVALRSLAVRLAARSDPEPGA